MKDSILKHFYPFHSFRCVCLHIGKLEHLTPDQVKLIGIFHDGEWIETDLKTRKYDEIVDMLCDDPLPMTMKFVRVRATHPKHGEHVLEHRINKKYKSWLCDLCKKWDQVSEWQRFERVQACVICARSGTRSVNEREREREECMELARNINRGCVIYARSGIRWVTRERERESIKLMRNINHVCVIYARNGIRWVNDRQRAKARV